MGSKHTAKTHRSLIWGVIIGAILTAILAFTSISALELISEKEPWPLIRETGPAIIALLVAFSSLIVSSKMFAEQKMMRQAGTDPVVLVYLGSREDSRNFATLEIENVGAGAAVNVIVELKTDLSAFFPNRVRTDFSKLQRIQTIPQNKSISFNLGLGHELLGSPTIPQIDFKVSYDDIGGTAHTSEQSIDIRELIGQRADPSLTLRAVQALETIQKSVSNNEPQQIVVQSLSSYERKKAEEHKELAAMFAKHKEN